MKMVTKFLKKYAILACSTGFFIIAVFVMLILGSIAPGDFPGNEIVSIKKDMSLTSAADMLKSDHVIKSVFLFKVYSTLVGGQTRVMAGDYLFSGPQSALRVAYRTTHGEQDLPSIKVTIPEGTDSSEMAGILHRDIPSFDAPAFTALAKAKEGYLFPDTYYFYPNVEPQEIVDTMSANFARKISLASSQLQAFPTTTDAVIKMASIVQEEATNMNDREIIAGILWKRIADGMPLAVDPPFYYFLGKSSNELTVADLAVDSPYNLYKNLGLPPTPIDSPGLDAILATVHPIASKYFYYLSGKDGIMHYAATLAEHDANKAKYLE